MDPKLVEGYLLKLRNQIFVDQSLKEKLRKTYLRKRRQRIIRRSLFSGLAVAILFFAIFSSLNEKSYVNASSLAVTNAISFFDVGSGEISSFTHHNEHLYVSIRNKGIYQYSHDGLTLIAEVVPDSFQFSPSGGSLIYSKSGNVSILNLNTMENQEILKKNTEYSYTYPTWKNEHSIYFAKQNSTESFIIEYDLRTNEEKEVTVGSQPTFIEKENKLAFEQYGNIIVKNLKNGEQQLVDKGKDPSVSKDGLYISYVKTENHFDDVWITDIDGKTKKKITSNPVDRVVSDRGLYQYSTPVWNLEEHEIYVLKSKDDNLTKIMKIKLSGEEISANETVEQYLQAIINRDDDYAKSMMEQPPDFLTYSNPQQIGYKILGSEKRADTVRVTAEGYWRVTASPIYQVSTYEFILYKKENRFIIKTINELSTKQIVCTDENEIQVTQGKEQRTLFSFEDIPKEYKTHENIRFSSIIENPLNNTIIFSLQEYETVGRSSEVSIISYNRETKAFRLISRIAATEGEDVVLEQISLDSTGQYLAANVSKEAEFPTLILLDIKNGIEISRFKSAKSNFWQGDHLLMTIKDENQTLKYQINPQTGKLKTF